MTNKNKNNLESIDTFSKQIADGKKWFEITEFADPQPLIINQKQFCRLERLLLSNFHNLMVEFDDLEDNPDHRETLVYRFAPIYRSHTNPNERLYRISTVHPSMIHPIVKQFIKDEFGDDTISEIFN